MINGVLRPIRTVLALSRPTITDGRDLRQFIVRTSTACVVLALFFDVFSQLVFFETWGVAARSWLITIVVGTAISVPVLSLIGQAYLELYSLSHDLETQSRTDPLTGLLNRRAVFEGEAEASDVLALVIADIDRFKRINDAHGHLVGDEVIVSVAGVLSRTLGDVGRVARIGGEEFAVLASGADAQALVRRVEEFRYCVAAVPVISKIGAVSVTVSAGIAIRTEGQRFDALYAEADRALFLAKAAGRNRVVLANEVPVSEAVLTHRSQNAT